MHKILNGSVVSKKWFLMSVFKISKNLILRMHFCHDINKKFDFYIIIMMTGKSNYERKVINGMQNYNQ